MKAATMIILLAICIALVGAAVILSFVLPPIVWARVVQYLRWNAPGLIFIVAQGLVIPAVVVVTIWGVRRSDRKANRDIEPESRDQVLRAHRNAEKWRELHYRVKAQRDDLRGQKRAAWRHAQMVLQDLEGE